MTVRDLRRNNHYSTAKRVLSVIEKWAYNYNRRNKDNDRNIHIVQLIEDGEEMQPSGNSVLVHVDFGNCDMLLIRNVIRQLNNSDLPIKGVIIRLSLIHISEPTRRS